MNEPFNNKNSISRKEGVIKDLAGMPWYLFVLILAIKDQRPWWSYLLVIVAGWYVFNLIWWQGYRRYVLATDAHRTANFRYHVTLVAAQVLVLGPVAYFVSSK